MKRYWFRVYTRKHGRAVSYVTVDARTLKDATKAARDYVCGSKGRYSAQYPQYIHRYEPIVTRTA